MFDLRVGLRIAVLTVFLPLITCIAAGQNAKPAPRLQLTRYHTLSLRTHERGTPQAAASWDGIMPDVRTRMSAHGSATIARPDLRRPVENRRRLCSPALGHSTSAAVTNPATASVFHERPARVSP